MKKLAFSIAKSRTKFLLLLLVIEMIILSCISPYFFNMNNLLQVTQFGATLTLLSLGEALVMISGRDGIDISIGSTMSLSGVIFGLAVMNGANIPIAAFITLLGGVVFGAVNGVLVAVAKVPALIATLGTQYIYSSLALYLTGGIPISGFPDSFALLSLKSTFGIPNQILFVVIPVSVLIFILVYKMKFGRRVYLMGTNPEAAKYAGIREMKVRAMVYVLAGVLASVSAIINNSWLMTARADAGDYSSRTRRNRRSRRHRPSGRSSDWRRHYHDAEFRSADCQCKFRMAACGAWTDLDRSNYIEPAYEQIC